MESEKKENSQCAIVEHWLPLFDRGWLSETCNPFQSSRSPFCKSWFEPIKIDKTNVLDHGRQVDRSETQNILCLSADSLSTKMSQDLKRRFSPDQWRQCQAAIPCFLEIRVSDMFQFGLGHVCRTLDQELLSLVSDTLKAYKEKHPSWVLLMKQIHEGWGLCKPKRVLLGHQMMTATPKDKERKTVRFGVDESRTHEDWHVYVQECVDLWEIRGCEKLKNVSQHYLRGLQALERCQEMTTELPLCNHCEGTKKNDFFQIHIVNRIKPNLLESNPDPLARWGFETSYSERAHITGNRDTIEPGMCSSLKIRKKGIWNVFDGLVVYGFNGYGRYIQLLIAFQFPWACCVTLGLEQKKTLAALYRDSVDIKKHAKDCCMKWTESEKQIVSHQFGFQLGVKWTRNPSVALHVVITPLPDSMVLKEFARLAFDF